MLQGKYARTVFTVNIQLQSSQAWNCILSEESVKGAVSSHNLELRATEIKGNSVKIKQLQRYFFN